MVLNLVLDLGGENRGIWDDRFNRWIYFMNNNDVYIDSPHQVFFRCGQNETDPRHIVIGGDGKLWTINDVTINNECFFKGNSGGHYVNLIRASGGGCCVGDGAYFTGIWASQIQLHSNEVYGSTLGGSVIVQSSDSKALYFGTASGNSGKTINVRGNYVRLYCHSGGGVYLGSSGSTAITSDENLKDISEISNKYETFFMYIKPITYKYKNNGHRDHMGFGARQVEQALKNADLTTENFAGILIDKDITISADESETEEDIHYDELYSLRYEEFIALNTKMIQKTILENRDLKVKMAALEQRLAALENNN